MALEAKHVRVSGVVQGVGFRPFVYRLAQDRELTGWVLNDQSGVEIHAEGQPEALNDFLRSIESHPPPAARIASLELESAQLQGFADFVIRESVKRTRPTVGLSPDLPVCDDCLRELFDPSDRRFHYPYINCTNCGPRYSIILGLPYDRERTTMGGWPMCEYCRAEYHDPLNRRFHAQPLACPQCGPNYYLRVGDLEIRASDALSEAVRMMQSGGIVALKGLGGYHLACDARSDEAVRAMRERKYRKDRPFALMVRDTDTAEQLVDLTPEVYKLLTSTQRPIVLARAKIEMAIVAPNNRYLGVMLPYTPLQHLLFAAGAPSAMVMTSANRSSEPIAYEDSDALEQLSGIADAFLIGEREIARRVDDSVACVEAFGVTIQRHARGYAPECVATLPAQRPILALGADLKSAIALVVDGRAFASQHIGDLEHYGALKAFKETARDLCAMYQVSLEDALVVHDAHPEYASTSYALSLPGEHLAVQHHRAHIASVLAERGELHTDVVGVAFDGTGYGDDGTIWGGEIFVGNVADGFSRVSSLEPASLPGGDAAARFPVQAAAGFTSQLSHVPDLTAPPFSFPRRYEQALQIIEKGVRVFSTTSVGRLFDTVAALLGFTREITFEAQAAMWLQHIAQCSSPASAYPFPLQGRRLDFRPLLAAVIADRLAGRNVAEIARGFHMAIANGVAEACEATGQRRIVLSGGVFANSLLLELLFERFGERIWINQKVPANDGGICLGQAAIAALSGSRHYGVSERGVGTITERG